MIITRPKQRWDGTRRDRRLFLFATLVALTLAWPPPLRGDVAEECELRFLVDGSAYLHAGVSAGIYGLSRVVGLGRATSMGVVVVSNVAKELYDQCGFNAGDVTGGVVGGISALILDVLFADKDGTPAESTALRVQVRDRRFQVGFRFGI